MSQAPKYIPRTGRLPQFTQVRPFVQEKPKVEKPEFDGPLRSEFQVDGKGTTYAEPRKSTEPLRKEAAEIMQNLINKFHEHRNVEQLKNDIKNKIFSDEVFTRNRILVFLIEYCVAGCIVELFEENHEFIQILNGLLDLDSKVKERLLKGGTFRYYSMRNLQSGHCPDKNHENIVHDLRRIFCTEERSDKMIALIDRLDPNGKIDSAIASRDSSDTETQSVERLVFGGEIVQPVVQPVIQRSTQPKKQPRFAELRDWTRVPITVADCFDFLENNPSFESVENLGENLVEMNEENLIKASMKLQMFKLFKSLFNGTKKSRLEKKVMVENSLPCFVEGLLLFPMKNELGEMTKFIVETLSYHPLGCYDKKHYPLGDELNKIITGDGFDKRQKSDATFCLNIIKKTNISVLCPKLMNDFFAQSLYYGYMNFDGLHQFCYDANSTEYIKSFSSTVTEISVLRDLIMANINKTLERPSQTGFAHIVQCELKTRLTSLLKTFPTGPNEKPTSNQINSRDNLVEQIDRLGKCNSDIFVKFAETYIVSGNSSLSNEMKNEFVTNLVSQIKILIQTNPHLLSPKIISDFNGFATKIARGDKTTIDFFGHDFVGFFLDNAKDIFAYHAGVNSARTAFAKKLLTEVCINISIFEGKKDEEFASELQGEFVGGVVALVREQLNGYIDTINAKLDEKEDVAKDKRELYHKIDTLKFIIDLLQQFESPFVERFFTNLTKIENNKMNSEERFDLF